MRRSATLLCVAAAVLLLLPWQICDCSEDGPHLKMLWDRATCADAGHSGPDDEPEEDCDQLFYVAGVQGSGLVELPTPIQHDAFVLACLGAPSIDGPVVDRGWDALAPPSDADAPGTSLENGTRLLV